MESDYRTTKKNSLTEKTKNVTGTPADWVDAHGDYLYNYAFSRLKNQVSAEDVVQETYLAALKSKESFAGQSSLRTWLVGILRHKIADHLRSSFRKSKSENELIEVSELEKTFWEKGKWTGHWNNQLVPSNWGDNPEGILQQKEFWEALDGCLKKLPTRLHSVFVLYQMEEQSTGEICKELEITPTNLWVMLHRARLQLRRCLELSWAGKRQKE